MKPHDLIAIEEAQLQRELANEREMNRAFARRCPGLQETECYRRDPPPAASFYTTSEALRWEIQRERARYNPARCALLRPPGAGCARPHPSRK
jgi:hypothetical protein